MKPVQNEDYVAFLPRKLVEWYQDAPARKGRDPPAGTEGSDVEAVPVWRPWGRGGGGGANDSGGVAV